MQKPSLQRCQTIFRAIILFSVLAGLMVSSGEGIRLFPFPASEITQDEQSRLKDFGETGYQENAFRSEKGDRNYLSKFHRNANQILAGNFTQPQNIPIFALSDWIKIKSSLNVRIFESQLISFSIGSRAPPFS